MTEPAPRSRRRRSAEFGRWLRRHKVTTAAGVVALVVVGSAAVVGSQLWPEVSALIDVRDAANSISANTSDSAALASSLQSLRDRAGAAESASRNPLLLATERVPLLGDNIAAVRMISQTVADLSGSTDQLADLLPQLSQKGQLSLAGSGRLVTVTEDLAVRCATGSTRLGQINEAALLPQLKDQITKARDGLQQAEAGIQRLSPYLKAMTILTSSPTQHEWLVVMQNLDEARPSGGMISSWKLLRSGQGKLALDGQGSNQDLLRTGPVDYRNTMPSGYQDVWGNSLSDWRSMNVAANFPDNAKLITKAWNDHHNRKIDGVLMLGQGSVEYLAAATGALTVGGKTIAPSAMTEYLTVGIYRDYPDPTKVDAVVAQLSADVFQRLSSGHIDVKSLMKAALGGGNSDQLLMWSSSADTRREIDAAGLSGAFGHEEGPVASVRLVNGGGNKLDAFARLAVAYKLGACSTDANDVSTRTSTLTVTLTNDAPASGLPAYMTELADLSHSGGTKNPPRGSNRDFLVVYAPRYSVVTGSTRDGSQATGQDALIDDRPMLVFTADLKPGESTSYTITWDEQAISTQDQPLATTPQVVLPPLINQPQVTVTPAEACR